MQYMNRQKLKIHSVKYNFIMSMILKMSTFIFPLITFPYVSRILGPEGNGKIAFATSFVYYFTMVAQLGIPNYGVKVCAQCRDDREALSRTTQELFIISTVMMLLSYAVMTVLILTVPKLQESMVLLFISSVTLVLTSIGMEWFYRAIEQYDYITFRNIAFKIIAVVLMLCLVRKPEDYILYGGITVIGNVGSNILNLIRVRRFIIIKPMGQYHILRHIRPTLTFFMLTVASTVYLNLDTVMLGFMTGDAEVGFYNAATKVKTILTSIVTSLGVVLLPRASYYIKQKRNKEFSQIIQKSFQFVIAMALPLTVYFIVEAGDAVQFLAGDGYAPAVQPMMIIMPTIFFIGLSNITGIQILVPLDMEKYTTISTVWGAVVDLVLNAIFIPKYGAAGAAFGTLVAEIVVLAVQLFYLRGKLNGTFDLKDAAKVVLAAVCATVGLLLIKVFFTTDSSFINLLVTAIVFFGIDGLVLIITKEAIIKAYVLDKLKEKFIKK